MSFPLWRYLFLHTALIYCLICSFISVCRTPFSISCRVGQVITNSLSVCFSGNILISLFWRMTLLDSWLTGVFFFSYLALWICISPCFLACKASDEKSNYNISVGLFLDCSVLLTDMAFLGQYCIVLITIILYVCMCVLVTQSCLTLCDPTDCSLPGFSVHGILQAAILEWIAIPFSRGTSQPRDRTLVSCITGRFFTIWATGKSIILYSKP